MLIIEYAIERSKAEILEDMAHGPVPVTVANFSELHDYVDANEYGGLCEDQFWVLPEDATDKELADNDGFYLLQKTLDLANAVQDAVNLWITSGDAQRDLAAVDYKTYQRLLIQYHDICQQLLDGVIPVATGTDALTKVSQRLEGYECQHGFTDREVR